MEALPKGYSHKCKKGGSCSFKFAKRLGKTEFTCRKCGHVETVYAPGNAQQQVQAGEPDEYGSELGGDN